MPTSPFRRLLSFPKASTWDLFSIRASCLAWSTGSYTVYFSLGILAYLRDKGSKCSNKVMEHVSVQATTARRVRTDLTPAAHLFIHIFLVSPHFIVLLRRETNWLLFEFFILLSHFLVRYKPLFLTSNLICTFSREKMSGVFGVFSLLLFIWWHFS